MKKATLLLGMVFFVAGILYLKDADANTVLIKQYMGNRVMEPLVQYTKEIVEKEKEESFSVPETTDGEVSSEETMIEETKKGSSLAFFKLSLEEQKVYSEILTSLFTLAEGTTLSSVDYALIDKVFQCVMLDHPEIFYVDGYKYTEYKSGNTVKKVTFTGNFLYSSAEITERQKRLDEKVAQIMAKVPDTDDEYFIVKYFYEALIRETEYDMGTSDNQNICSVFLNEKSVCQGYAKAFQYLLHQAGMEAGLVIGTVKNGDSHAWNLVCVNENWYYVDVTWGDANYQLNEEVQEQTVTGTSYVNYDYLCVTTKQMNKTHSLQMPFNMQECTSMADNYYVREGLYFTEYDEQKIEQLFSDAIDKDLEAVTIKCSDDSVFEMISRELIEEQKVFSYLAATDGVIAYTDNKEQGSITFWL